MKDGYERIIKPLKEYLWLYKYEGVYYPREQIVRVAKDWTQITRQTKYKILDSPARWNELEKYGVEAFVADRVGANHYILTNGVLLSNTLREVCKNNKSYVEFVEDGKAFRIFRASLVIMAFLDPEYDINTDKPYYLDGDMLNCDINNVVVLDTEKTRRKKK